MSEHDGLGPVDAEMLDKLDALFAHAAAQDARSRDVMESEEVRTSAAREATDTQRIMASILSVASDELLGAWLSKP